METLTLVFNYHQLSGKCQFIKLNNTFNKYLPSNDVKKCHISYEFHEIKPIYCILGYQFVDYFFNIRGNCKNGHRNLSLVLSNFTPTYPAQRVTF